MISKTITCPICGCPCNITKWVPIAGYDPRLRQYQCRKCERYLFKVYIPDKEAKLPNTS